MNVILGGLGVVTGIGLLHAAHWLTGAVLSFAGVIMCASGMAVTRMHVTCSQAGIEFRTFRRTFIPTEDISQLTVAPVAGVGSLQRTAVAVLRRDGTSVRLDPTLVVNSGPDDPKMRDRIAQIERVLGMNHDA